ncbi:hypothetical protein VP01_71g10 [Puccinia sorghi]|uniref:Uncharacterized protein n=1 Tax=Puccinia sorghi TaxID=27349 RepID=A0A0L6UE51_9BASI|nr:hypothetical protein VP01_71g10 [Puccinia sorghi]
MVNTRRSNSVLTGPLPPASRPKRPKQTKQYRELVALPPLPPSPEPTTPLEIIPQLGNPWRVPEGVTGS